MSGIGGPGGGDVTKWNGTSVATPDTAGYPKVTHKTGSGTGEILLSSGAVTAGTVNDKTGYSLTAGSYSVRASNSQRGTATTGASTGDVSISAVTTTRATANHAGQNCGAVGDAGYCLTISQLISTTTVRFTKGANSGTQNNSTEVFELF